MYHQSKMTNLLSSSYRLPASTIVSPRYIPALNQVWVPEHADLNENLTALNHEFIHAYSISLQPPQLLPLDDVFKNAKYSSVKRFEDLVESLCEAYYNIRLSSSLKNIQLTSNLYPDLFASIIHNWKRLLKYASTQLTYSVAAETAIRGLFTLLLHVVPKKPNTGLTIIKLLDKFSPPSYWKSSQDIWGAWYKDLDICIGSSAKLRKEYTLAMPAGVHRSVADTIYFISQSLYNFPENEEVLTAIFPTLLSLISQNSFTLMPIAFVSKDRSRYKVHYKILHTTYHSKRLPDRMAKELCIDNKKMTNQGISCSATTLFTKLVRSSLPFRLTNNSERTYECFQKLFNILLKWLKKYENYQSCCSGCRLLFQDTYFQAARDNILSTSEIKKRKYFNTFHNYEYFLKNKVTLLIKKDWELPTEPNFIKHYRFL